MNCFTEGSLYKLVHGFKLNRGSPFRTLRIYIKIKINLHSKIQSNYIDMYRLGGTITASIEH